MKAVTAGCIHCIRSLCHFCPSSDSRQGKVRFHSARLPGTSLLGAASYRQKLESCWSICTVPVGRICSHVSWTVWPSADFRFRCSLFVLYQSLCQVLAIVRKETGGGSFNVISLQAFLQVLLV